MQLARHFALILLGFASVAEAKGKGFWSRYNLGISYEASRSYAAISYDAPGAEPYPDDCVKGGEDPQQMRCTAYLGPSTDDTPMPSLYIDSPFQRTGLLYFDYGLSVATLSYTGGLVSKPKAPAPTRPLPGGTQKKTENGQPLQQAYLELYGINWQTYLRFGLTPRYAPDLILTLGLGLQTVGGRVQMFKNNQTRFLAQPEAFGEVELVVLRAYTGALSFFVGTDSSLTSGALGKLIDDNPDGSSMTNFQLGLSTSSAGVNLLLPF
jgi:hypothetical protein